MKEGIYEGTTLECRVHTKSNITMLDVSPLFVPSIKTEIVSSNKINELYIKKTTSKRTLSYTEYNTYISS
jgi:hypothetical protein